MATLAGLGLWVKTLVFLGLDDGDTLHRYPLGGVVVEFRFPSGTFWCLRWQVLCSMCFYFYLSLVCFVRVSPHQFVSVRPFDFIYKAGRKPVSNMIT